MDRKDHAMSTTFADNAAGELGAVTMPPGAQAALSAQAAEISADLPAPLSIGDIVAVLEVGACHLAEVRRGARRLSGGAVPYELTAAGTAAAEQDGDR